MRMSKFFRQGFQITDALLFSSEFSKMFLRTPHIFYIFLSIMGVRDSRKICLKGNTFWHQEACQVMDCNPEVGIFSICPSLP